MTERSIGFGSRRRSMRVSLLLVIALVAIGLLAHLWIRHRVGLLCTTDFSQSTNSELNSVCRELTFYHERGLLNQMGDQFLVYSAMSWLGRRYAAEGNYKAAIRILDKLLGFQFSESMPFPHEAYRCKYYYALMERDYELAARVAESYRCELLDAGPHQKSWKSVSLAYALQVRALLLGGDLSGARALLFQATEVLCERKRVVCDVSGFGKDVFVDRHRDAIFILLADAAELSTRHSDKSVDESLAKLQGFFEGQRESGMKVNIDSLLQLRLVPFLGISHRMGEPQGGVFNEE